MKQLSTFLRSVSAFLLLATLNMVFAPAAAAFTTSPQSLPQGKLVDQTSSELIVQGCVTATPQSDGTLSIADDKPSYVIAKDQAINSYFFCPTTVVPTSSQTDASTHTAAARNPQVKPFFIPILLVAAIATYFIAPGLITDGVYKGLLTITLILDSVIATVLYWILIVAGVILGNLLTQRHFISHPIVTHGWPIFQGIANLAFLGILLYIALLIVLRADGGKGLQRMVPKLLFAALLVNFSLVICGAIIDASRMVMALTVRNANFETLVNGVGEKWLSTSPLFTDSFAIEKTPVRVGFSVPFLIPKIWHSEPPATGECSDKNDNDGDGRIDWRDPDCHIDGVYNSNIPTSFPGSNNDNGPNWATYDRNDNSEAPATCNDGKDNDNINDKDQNDPSCNTDPAGPGGKQWNPEATEGEHIPAKPIKPVKPPPPPKMDLALVFQVTSATVFIAIVTIGCAYLAIGVFKRYVSLILLCMASPVSYLGLAFPNTLSITKSWWDYFIRNVLYGPLAVLTLVLVKNLPTSFIFVDPAAPAAAGPEVGLWIQFFANVAMMSGILIVASRAAEKIGGIGAKGAINQFQRYGKKAGSWAMKNPGTAAVIAGFATGGLGTAVGYGLSVAGGRILGKGAANQARDFKDTATKHIAAGARAGKLGASIPGVGGVVAYTAKAIAGPKRDDKGKLKKGQPSAGKSLGNLFSGLNPYEVRDQNQTADIGSSLKGGTLTAADLAKPPTTGWGPYFTPYHMKKGNVAKAFGDSNINVIAEHSTDVNMLTGIAQNEDYLRKLGEAERVTLMKSMRDNKTGLAADQIRRAIEQLQRTMDKVDAE